MTMRNIHHVSDGIPTGDSNAASNNALSEPIKRPFIMPKLAFVKPELTKQGALVHLTTQASDVTP